MTERVVPIGRGSSEEFTVPASDEKGHSARKWFRIQPGYAQMISNIVQRQVFPYRGEGELVRHAIVRHLHYLESISPEPIPSVLAQADAILELCREEEYRSSFKDTLDRVTEVLNMYIAQGDFGEARRLLLRVKSKINAMPDSYWRDRYLQKLEKDHGHLLENAPKASLVPLKALKDED